MNLLPYEGTAHYQPHFLAADEASHYFQGLLGEIEWKNDELIMFGRRIVTSRKTAWYGDQPFAYTYSHTTKAALSWSPFLAEIKQRVVSASGEAFNACLLNLYHHGQEGMGWHSDDEPTIVPHSAIASISLGASRKFSFRHKRTKETISLLLESGSLLLMKGETQQSWHHSLPKTARVHEPRINLTFRTMKPQ